MVVVGAGREVGGGAVDGGGWRARAASSSWKWVKKSSSRGGVASILALEEIRRVPGNIVRKSDVTSDTFSCEVKDKETSLFRRHARKNAKCSPWSKFRTLKPLIRTEL